MLNLLAAAAAASTAPATITELVTQYGFNISSLDVPTADGCMLTLFYLTDPAVASTSPVLLQHGFEDSATTWVINAPNQSLGFMLARAGHRVYLGNSRGNRYSSGVLAHSRSSRAYWDWSFDEMGRHDLPAVVAAIKRHSGAASVPIVGHSQGTTQTFLALSSNVTMADGSILADSVPLFVALAPATSAMHMSSPIFDAAFRLDIDALLALAGAYDLLANGTLPAAFSALVCGAAGLQPACDLSIQLLFGYNHSHLDFAGLRRYMDHVPSGTSIFDLVHFAQNYRHAHLTGAPCFRRYDHGPLGNLRRYGQLSPPEYDLSAMPAQTKLAVYSGSIDTLADPRDVAWLVSRLPRPPLLHRKLAGYGHVDFVWGTTAAADIYEEVLALLAAEGRADQPWRRRN
jgi:hypothetical protein